MKHIVATILWCLGTVPVSAQPPEQVFEAVTEDLKLEQLTAGVWRHVSYHEVEGFGRVPGNGLLVVSGKTGALIDTPWTGEQTRELFGWAKQRLSAEIAVVVATHSHQDCAGGLAAAHRLGARSYASKKTAKLARRGGQALPQTTFKRSLEVAVGALKLKLHAAGPGHTADNIVVWIPEEEMGRAGGAPGVLFGGCLVRSAASKNLGYTREADLERWPRTIETLIEAYGDARWIVPGHGRPGGAELLHHTLELLAAGD